MHHYILNKDYVPLLLRIPCTIFSKKTMHYNYHEEDNKDDQTNLFTSLNIMCIMLGKGLTFICEALI